MTARPDAAVRSGSFSVGTAGKLIVAQELSTPGGLRSTLSASLALESPGTVHREASASLRHGSARWVLDDGRGERCELTLFGDAVSTTLGARFETRLPTQCVLSASGEARWARMVSGPGRSRTASVAVRRRFARAWTVQPGLHLVDWQGLERTRWAGADLRVEWRNAEWKARLDGSRGSWMSVRKIWHRGPARYVLGGQRLHDPAGPDRALVEVGVARGAIGVRLYAGSGQRAAVVSAGRIQFGMGLRPSERLCVLGVGNLSFTMAERADGERQFGMGFVFRETLCGVARDGTGWKWRAPASKQALSEPHLRWPGLVTLLD